MNILVGSNWDSTEERIRCLGADRDVFLGNSGIQSFLDNKQFLLILCMLSFCEQLKKDD